MLKVKIRLQPGRKSKPDPRNKTMLRMFSYANVGERAGPGAPTIAADWTGCGYDAPRWE